MKNSYIHLWRSIKDTAFYKKPLTCHLAIHLILSAAWKDHEQFIGGKNVLIRRGQIPTGRKRLAEETGLSPQNIRTCLNHLVRCGFLTIESTNVCSVITICKYEQYQPNQQCDQPTNQPTINQPSTNHQPLQNTGYKDINNNSILADTICGTHAPRCPQKVIFGLYREILPELTAHKVWDGQRAQHLANRWKAKYKNAAGQTSDTVEYWRGLFQHIRNSDFLMGRANGRERPFRCSLEWIVKKANFEKIIDGKYHH